MRRKEYTAIPGDIQEQEEKRQNNTGRAPSCFSRLLYLSICTAIGIVIGIAIGALENPLSRTPWSTCSKPVTRMEWRSLDHVKKVEYLEAVKCLTTTNSSLRGMGTLHDDFVWVHEEAGRQTHLAASFLPWHRMFVHIYERTLVEKCGYGGHMPYWDWALDWQNVSQSSIFNSIGGFGGDGNTSFPIEITEGRCVTDGPFSNLQLLYYKNEVQPHCLSRNFWNNETQTHGSMSGKLIQPNRMGALLRAPTYERFGSIVENSMHNAIHRGINGDFGQFTAANDPLFFLHHAQLDRLWWSWQHTEPQKRFTEYTGRAVYSAEGNVSLDDDMAYLGLWGNVKVSDVMRTDTSFLCYRY